MHSVIPGDLAVSALDVADTAVLITDARAGDNPIVFANQAFERMTGYCESEMLGKNPRFLQRDDHDQSELSRIRAALAENAPTTVVLRNYRKDGTQFLNKISVAPIGPLGERPTHYVGIHTDVTEQKQVQQDSRNREAQLDSILATKQTAIVTIDTSGVITTFSTGAERLFGYSADEVIGQNVKMLMPEPYRAGHDRFIQDYLNTGEKKVIGIGREFKARKENGSIIDIFLEINDLQIDGKTVFTGIIHDITQQKRLDVIRVARERALGKLAAGAALTDVTADIAEVIEQVAPEVHCSIYLIDRQTRRLSKAAAPRLPDFFTEAIESLEVGPNIICCGEASHSGQRVIVEDITTHPNWVDHHEVAERAGLQACWAEPIVATSGEVLGSLALYYRTQRLPEPADIGFLEELAGIVAIAIELSQAKEQLLQAQKLESIGRLTGGVAHDFNNLLTVILGNLELLEKRISDESLLTKLRDAKEATELGAGLTADLLAFARRQTLSPKTVNLNQLVLGMSDLIRRTLGETIHVSVTLAKDLRSTKADPGQIQNALLNLAINARDAMPSGGHLTIETANITVPDTSESGTNGDRRPGNYVRLSVGDSGLGMTPEVQRLAFEPFFTTKSSTAGSGLGLSTIYGFAIQSGGFLDLDSEPGKGTTVRLTLPAAESRPVPANCGSGLDEPVGKGETILLVEDDARVRRITEDHLTDLGYKVFTAENAGMALEVLRVHPDVKLVFTDVVMPGGMSGTELAERVRALYPKIKILLTSGYAEDLVDQVGRCSAETGVLRKPYTRKALAGHLDRLLGSDQFAAP